VGFVVRFVYGFEKKISPKISVAFFSDRDHHFRNQQVQVAIISNDNVTIAGHGVGSGHVRNQVRIRELNGAGLRKAIGHNNMTAPPRCDVCEGDFAVRMEKIDVIILMNRGV